MCTSLSSHRTPELNQAVRFSGRRGILKINQIFKCKHRNCVSQIYSQRPRSSVSTRGIRLRRDAQPWLLCRTGMLAPELPPCGGPLHSPPISDTARPTLVRTALAPPCGVAGAAASLRHRTPLAPPLFGSLGFSRHPRLFCPLL